MLLMKGSERASILAEGDDDAPKPRRRSSNLRGNAGVNGAAMFRHRGSVMGSTGVGTAASRVSKSGISCMGIPSACTDAGFRLAAAARSSEAAPCAIDGVDVSSDAVVVSREGGRTSLRRAAPSSSETGTCTPCIMEDMFPAADSDDLVLEFAATDSDDLVLEFAATDSDDPVFEFAATDSDDPVFESTTAVSEVVLLFSFDEGVVF